MLDLQAFQSRWSTWVDRSCVLDGPAALLVVLSCDVRQRHKGGPDDCRLPTCSHLLVMLKSHREINMNLVVRVAICSLEVILICRPEYGYYPRLNP